MNSRVPEPDSQHVGPGVLDQASSAPPSPTPLAALPAQAHMGAGCLALSLWLQQETIKGATPPPDDEAVR
jgi:hypothetical protein